MSDRVPQHVASWSDWPADVTDRLRDWNSRYLLSFDHHGDFVCEGGCHREIAAHEFGNARLRATRKGKAVVVCEDCLIAIARANETPPELHPRRVALLQERHRYERLAAYTDRLEHHHLNLHRQISTDQAYIDELEKRLPPIAVEEARAAMRARRRNVAGVRAEANVPSQRSPYSANGGDERG